MEGNNYKVLELDNYGGQPKPGTRQFRDLKEGEVLIKVHCTTIHPVDLVVMKGVYVNPAPKLPIVPGAEGSGEVVKIGTGVDEKLAGKRVALALTPKGETYEGLWAEYIYAPAKVLLVYNTNVPYERIAFSLVNPGTAVGFLDTVKKAKVKAIVQNGASSALGKMIIRLFASEGIKTINLVRNQKHIKHLIDIGADHVLDTSDPTWEVELAKLATELEAKIGLDCVGGESTYKVFAALPDCSTLYHYGNLEVKPISNIGSRDLISRHKILTGWSQNFWRASLTPEEVQYWHNYIIKSLEGESSLFVTETAGSYNLDDVNTAMKDYLFEMSKGKVLIKPQGK